jgi:hypothetical protein
MLGNLLALLRLEVGATDRWRSTSAAVGIEQVLSAQRQGQLNCCIAGSSVSDLRAAMQQAMHLGQQVCAAISAQYGWPWPQQLAERVTSLLNAPPRSAE